MVDRAISADERKELKAKGLMELPPDAFTVGDVMRDLARPAGLEAKVAAWKRRRDPEVVAFVTGFAHTVLPAVTPKDVRSCLAGSSHALGGVSKAHNIDPVRTANPDWALEYVFYRSMEARGRVPTWDEFRVDLIATYADCWYTPVRRLCETQSPPLEPHVMHKAMQWRAGNAWQGFIRNVHVVATLRQVHGLPVKFHMLAHVLLKVDGWLGNRLIQLWVPSANELHKEDPRTIFAQSGFALSDIRMTGSGYGHVWLPPDRAIDDLADFLTEA